MTPLDPFALGGYAMEPPSEAGQHDLPGIAADTRSCPLLNLWREYKAIETRLGEMTEYCDEEDRLVDRFRIIEDEIAGSIATNATDLMVQLTLLVSHWRDREQEWSDFAGDLLGKMYLGLYAIEATAT